MYEGEVNNIKARLDDEGGIENVASQKPILIIARARVVHRRFRRVVPPLRERSSVGRWTPLAAECSSAPCVASTTVGMTHSD